MSPQMPRSATSIYGGVVAAVTTIAVSIILFRKLRETGNKSQDKGVSKQGHGTNTSQPQLFIGQDAREEQNFNNSIPGQASATPRPRPIVHSAGDEGQLEVSVPSHSPWPPSTTSEPQFVDQDDRGHILIPAQAFATLRPQPVIHFAGDEGQLDISVPSHTTSEPQFVDQDNIPIPTQASTTPRPQPVGHFVGDEGQLDISVSSHAPPTTSESQFFNQDATDEPNHDISIPAQAPTLRPHEDMGNEKVSSISFSQGSSNVQISETNANAILNGKGQFTKIQKNLICDCVVNSADINNNLKEHVLTHSITTLPRAEAGFRNGYQNKKSGPCFNGTRVALLREMADCVTGSFESRMYVLSGLAGVGKSTIAYTIASRAANLNLLGASFFFSRDDADRNNAKRFFTSIAHQLCVYNETFAKAIGDVLATTNESLATTLNPQLQLKLFILDPLRNIIQSRSRPILIVVDALDECDEEDASFVLNGLYKLVQDLPSFKVVLTTRPQLYLDTFLDNQDDHKFFHLQNTEYKVIDSDIRLYLDHNLSMKQVQKCCPMQGWCASDEEIDALVCAAGKFFVIASTAVRYILDKKASNPAAQMQKLLRTSTQGQTPFKNLDHVYTVILRDVVPQDCDDNDIVSHYQSVVGAIIFVQRPLPVSTLTHLIGIDAKEIHAVLDNLQSVIFLGDDDVPHIYHQLFREYLMDQARCKDPHLRIDLSTHTEIAIRCFEIMSTYLKRNILGLGNPARFMNNEDGLKEDGITDEQLQEKIPQVLRYACVYWINHLEMANVKDGDLMNCLSKFVDEQILYWLEVLSLIGKLDSAHHAIVVVLKVLPSTSSDLHQLLSDVSHFISKFYEIIKRSALHTYYSALPFTPTDSLLYYRYIKEAEDNIYAIEGGPEIWNGLVAHNRQGYGVRLIKFSLDSTLLVSCSDFDDEHNQGQSQICDAVTGTPISVIPGYQVAVANDFSTFASSDLKDTTITLYNVNGTPSSTILTTRKVQNLALSSESSRVAATLDDGTIWLWESGNAELIDNFRDGYEGDEYWCWLRFSPTGRRLAYESSTTNGGGIKLRDGISGGLIADLQCGPDFVFEFSGDGSRIASMSKDCGLTLWDSENGALIAVIRNICHNRLAISANGALLATADDYSVSLWAEDHLAQIKVLETEITQLIAFSLNNILAIATNDDVKLYNVNNDSFIHTLPVGRSPTALLFSPDCTRLAVGDYDGNVNLWNIQGIDASGPHSNTTTPIVSALALSRDCLRLACGFSDGTVELWGTSPTTRRIASHQKAHWDVSVICFGLDGGLFASWSDTKTIKLWNGKDGSLRGTLKASNRPMVMAFSNNVLVAAGHSDVTLWSLDTLSRIRTLRESSLKTPIAVSIAENNALIAVAYCHSVTLLDAENDKTIITFDVLDEIHAIAFLPDNHQLVAQSKDGVLLTFSLINKHVMKGAAILERLIQLPNISLCHGVQIWHYLDKKQHYFAALVPQHKNPAPVLWIPRNIPVTAYTQGLSMIALSCWDGRIILLRLPTTLVA